jgi:hypothetical protein
MSSANIPPRSGGSSRRARGPPGSASGASSGSGRATAADARRALITARYQASAQIRKRRKEEILLEKRRGGSIASAAFGVTEGGSSTTSTSIAPHASPDTAQSPFFPGDDPAFQRSLEEFLQNPPSLGRLEALVAQWDRAVAFLQRWLERHRGGGDDPQQRILGRYLEHLRAMMVFVPIVATDAASSTATATATAMEDGGSADPAEKGRIAALKLVEALVSTAAPVPQADEDLAYYSGATGQQQQSLGWSCAIAQRGEAWFPTLVALLPLYPCEVGSILSHLYQDSSHVVVTLSKGTVAAARSLLIPQFWPNIAAALSVPSSHHQGGAAHPPEVARLASVIMQDDATTPGMQFLQGNSNSGGGGGLTSLTLAQLLHDPSTAVSAAWMLEGLTRREDAAVELLCQDSTLVAAITSALHFHANVAATQAGEASDASVVVLLPMLRSMGNIVIACDGRPLALFENVLSDGLGVTLAGVPRVADEVLWVMGCCLVDSGKPHHVATSKLAPLWVPQIVSVLTEEASKKAVRFEVKRQALASLWIALSMPPDVETFAERSAIQANLDSILLQLVCNSGAIRGAANLVDSLVLMMGVSDVDTVLSALRVLQRLALVVPSERDNLRSRHVLDRLEEVHDQQGVSPAGDLASNLLELLQEDDDDDDDVDGATGANQVNPTMSNGSYTFGLPTMVALNPAPRSSAPDVPTPLGRGRGRPVPSWMEQRQEQSRLS